MQTSPLPSDPVGGRHGKGFHHGGRAEDHGGPRESEVARRPSRSHQLRWPTVALRPSSVVKILPCRDPHPGGAAAPLHRRADPVRPNTNPPKQPQPKVANPPRDLPRTQQEPCRGGHAQPCHAALHSPVHFSAAAIPAAAGTVGSRHQHRPAPLRSHARVSPLIPGPAPPPARPQQAPPANAAPRCRVSPPCCRALAAPSARGKAPQCHPTSAGGATTPGTVTRRGRW